MPTFHTAIATGAAADASTFNTPLAAIDTALAVSHDADGTLKAGAVDNAAALASDVVTTAKILDANVTNAKLATDVKIGSLASLTTTIKTSIQAAINELVTSIAANVVSIAANTASILGITGGASVSTQQLKDWTEAQSYELTSITYSTTYPTVISTATVKWPDASAGTFTATTINSTWSAIDAYTITHSTASKTVTQSAISRNTAGQVTSKPALSVA